MTIVFFAMTSSRTSKSRVSPGCASADEMVRAVLSLTGVPSSNPNPCIAALGSVGVDVAGGCCAGVVDAAVFVAADWESAGDATRDKIASKEVIILNMSNSPLRGTLEISANSRGEGVRESPYTRTAVLCALSHKSQ